jgi:prevent-host-death family protein
MRYKPFGRMLVVEPPTKLVEEVTLRELSRNASGIVARVGEGTRAVVTRHGVPVAVILEVEEAVGLCGSVLLTRQEAERRLFGLELEARLRERRARRLRRHLESRGRETA